MSRDTERTWFWSFRDKTGNGGADRRYSVYTLWAIDLMYDECKVDTRSIDAKGIYLYKIATLDAADSRLMQ
jgi:hypothetical protein